MVTAISSSLYLYLSEEENFNDDIILSQYILVAGDFSGVQDFVYTITSKGALKTLKARSFFLELLMEHIIYEILLPLDLSRTNIISSGGGRFYLLLPNTEPAVKILREVRERINLYLKNEYEAKLCFILEWEKFNDKFFYDNERYKAVWGSLSNNIRESKQSKFREFLPELFEIKYENTAIFECHICHKTTLEKDVIDEYGISFCPICHSLYNLGQNIFDAKYISRTDAETGIKIENKYYNIISSEELRVSKEPVWIINSWDTSDYKNDYFYPLIMANNYIKKESGPYDFEDYANLSTGINRIAVLRMDVDSLGSVFFDGFQEKQNILRISSLSRHLNMFFRYYLNRICKDRKIATIYAGGDDVFVVGAWDEVIQTGFDIREHFKRYTLNSMTISGGFAVFSPKFPLYQMARIAGEAEDEAKTNEYNGEMKNSFTFFYNSHKSQSSFRKNEIKLAFSWFEAENKVKKLQNEIQNILLKEQEDGSFSIKVSQSYIYKLLSIVDLWQMEGKLYLPKLAWVIKRTEESLSRLINNEKDMQEQWATLKNRLLEIDVIEYLYPVLVWVAMLIRGKEENK
jgi:CRISPR-associated protein Csm1